MARLPAFLALLAGVPLAQCNMYDVLSPLKVPGAACKHGCAEWADQNATTNSWWSGGKPPANAGSSCAQLAKAPGLSKPTPVLDPKGVGGGGAWCMCKEGPGVAPNAYAYCTSATSVPEQINLQIAGPDTVVVSFVTFEHAPPPPGATPVAQVGASSDPGAMKGVACDATNPCVTHEYVTPSKDRTYYMHFVTLSNLPPRTRFFYRVASAAGGTWSAVYSFRSPYGPQEGGLDGGTPTRVAIFGDMGIYSWNNLANMQKDNEEGLIDLVVQMGDHCYNIGGYDDTRGDGYMEAYQAVIANIPWLPIVGNHEYYDGDQLRRYLNQTEGTVVAHPAGHALVKGASTTADTALGRMLTAGNHHGAGTHGGGAAKGASSGPASGTSRYYSVDFGLVHFVALDLNMYNGVDTCGETCREAQLAWLEKDLTAANANRGQVPWIVAMSHFPLYCSNCPTPGNDPPGAWWNSEQCEFEGHGESCGASEAREASLGGRPPPPPPPGLRHQDMVPDFEPLFMKHGVDVYSSGHIHDYEFIYPTYNNTAVQKNFVDPKAPVHLVTGNGGPPSPSHFGVIQPWSFVHSNVYSYTRLIAHNSSTMEWLQIANNDSAVLTRLVVTQSNHAAFPIPAAAA